MINKVIWEKYKTLLEVKVILNIYQTDSRKSLNKFEIADEDLSCKG